MPTVPVMDEMIVEVDGKKVKVEFPAEAGTLSRKLIREATEALLRGISSIKLTVSTDGHKREVNGGLDRGKMHLEFYSWKEGDKLVWSGPLSIKFL